MIIERNQEKQQQIKFEQTTEMARTKALMMHEVKSIRGISIINLEIMRNHKRMNENISN